MVTSKLTEAALERPGRTGVVLVRNREGTTERGTLERADSSERDSAESPARGQ